MKAATVNCILTTHRPPLRFSSVVVRHASSSAAASSSSSPDKYCSDLVQQHDHAAYLTSYFYPSVARPAFFALHAFNIELELIGKKVSKAALAQMRYQWWKDAIKGVFSGTPLHHPVPLALHAAAQIHQLQPYHLNRILTAHSTLLPPATTLPALTTFARSTRSSLLYLSLSILPPLPPNSPTNEDRTMHAASHVGQAVGLVRILDAAARGEGPLGRSFQGGVERWKERVAEVVRAAGDEIKHARGLFVPEGLVPREMMPAFLAAIPPQVYLDALERAGGDPRTPKARSRDWRTAWRIWRGWRTCRF